MCDEKDLKPIRIVAMFRLNGHRIPTMRDEKHLRTTRIVAMFRLNGHRIPTMCYEKHLRTTRIVAILHLDGSQTPGIVTKRTYNHSNILPGSRKVFKTTRNVSKYSGWIDRRMITPAKSRI